MFPFLRRFANKSSYRNFVFAAHVSGNVLNGINIFRKADLELLLDMDFELSLLTRDVLKEREIREEWVWLAVDNPD